MNCKDCKYFVNNEQCYRYPTPVETISTYWCGEWKEKTVIDNPLLGFKPK